MAKGEFDLSVFSLRDLLSEGTSALTARPARTLLTALGTVLGVAALVATLGLAQTAGGQIVGRFDELEATRVEVTPRQSEFAEQQSNPIPFDAPDRLERLNGVVAVGTKTILDLQDARASSVPIVDPLGQTEFQIPTVAASPRLFHAVRATLGTGRVFDSGHDSRGNAVAVLGPAAAARLNINRIDFQPVVFVGDHTLTVIGILEDVEREPDLLSAIIVPNGWAQQNFELEAPEEVHIDVRIGAAELIGSQASLALAPGNPNELRVVVPPSPVELRSGVETDVDALFLVLGGISLLVGAIGIANVTLVAVLERTSEIGLRRALGATRSHIGLQFILESVTLGALGGIIGSSLGIIVIVGVSANRQWTPILEPSIPIAAPMVGAVIGLLAGLYPATKAANIEPINALRSA